MSTLAVTKKASLLGSWHEDVFTDELVKKIAAYAAAEKGKKAKVSLTGSGLKITRARFLQADQSQFYTMPNVKTVARNPGAPDCVMFILADPRRKYQIVAIRCATESDAAHLVSFAAQLKRDQQSSNVEFRKRDNGIWTLRERSAHNANRHMAELFNQQSGRRDDVPATNVTTAATPIVIGTAVATATTVSQNGGVHNHVPVLDRSRGNVTRGSYVKRHDSQSPKLNGKHPEDYVIITEVANDHTPPKDDVDALKGQVTFLTNEMNEMKAAMKLNNNNNNNNNTTVILPSKPQVTTITSSEYQPVVYRSPPKIYEARLSGPSAATYYGAPHRRASASFSTSKKSRDPTDSAQGSSKVTFDSQSIASNTSRRSKSLRLFSSQGSIPTTIQRSIEDTYARPVVVRRHGSAHAYNGRPRPVSYHVVGNTELKVFETRGRSYDDVVL